MYHTLLPRSLYQGAFDSKLVCCANDDPRRSLPRVDLAYAPYDKELHQQPNNVLDNTDHSFMIPHHDTPSAMFAHKHVHSFYDIVMTTFIGIETLLTDHIKISWRRIFHCIATIIRVMYHGSKSMALLGVPKQRHWTGVWAFTVCI